LLSADTVDYLSRERFKWECPVARWDEHLRHIFHKDGCKKDEPDVEPGPETSRWAHE
jgi:hypothetical protein